MQLNIIFILKLQRQKLKRSKIKIIRKIIQAVHKRIIFSLIIKEHIYNIVLFLKKQKSLKCNIH